MEDGTIHEGTHPEANSGALAEDKVVETPESKRKGERDQSEHFWGQLFRTVFNFGLVVLIAIVLFIVVGAVVALGWHMLVPWIKWLEPDELRVVKDFLLSGAMVSLGIEYFRKYIKG